MNRIAAIVLTGCLLLGLAGCGVGGEALSPTETRQQDLDTLYKSLSSKHKNLFATTPKEEYDQAKAALEKRLPDLSDVEFFHALEEFTALAGDGHTGIVLDSTKVSPYAFKTGLPFAVAKFEGSWHLFIANAENAAHLGAKVTAIEGIPISEVYQRAATLVSHDTDAWMDSQFSNTINFIDTLHYLGVTNSMESVTLTLDSGGKMVDAVFPAMSEEEITTDLARLEPTMPQTYPDGSYYRALALNPQVLFLQYNTCTKDPNYPMATFVSDVRELLNQGAYEKVIVDLRYNSGGNSSIWDPMTDMLKSQMAERGFALHCLIGENTFSSGILNAIDMKKIGAQLTGTPTGGSANHYGEVKSQALPHSPFVFTYSIKYFNMAPELGQGSLHPDLLLEPTFEGYMAGIDEAVEAVLKA